MEDEEYKKLPIEDRCCHKLWQARKSGYEDATKLFRQIDDDKSPEFGKYLGLIKKFVLDSHAVGQEKGLEATLAFVENYAHAGKTVGEVMSGVISKCIAAPKNHTKELAVQVILMYIEIEKGDFVQEELLKGLAQKNPKIVAACIGTFTTALKEFGSKIIQVKPLVKKIPDLFSDRDKTVRDEAKIMVVEIYRWIGEVLKSQLNTLKPVQIAELEAEFSKVQGVKPIPQRYIRSEQQKQIIPSAENEEVDAGGSDEAQDQHDSTEMDPYDLADPVDILSQLPKDFYEKIEEKKWQLRKEALEEVERLTKNPRLQNGDYGDLVRALKKVIDKDSNVVVTALAGRCLAAVATGLKKRFQPYAGACVPSLLEKFKEKKQNVVVAVKEAVDVIYLSTTLEAILEEVIEALGNKNPSVKAETSMFLARAFTKTQPTAITKKTLKALCTPLLKNINESDPNVRDSAAEALGTLMKLMGEKSISPFLVDLEKDAIKMTKIKECCDKAVITVKIVAPKKERPATAPTKAPPPKGGKAASGAPKSAPNKTNAAPKKKAPATKVAKSASTNSLDDLETETTGESENTKDTVSRSDISVSIEPLLTELEDKNWKVRTEALTKINQIIEDAKSIKPNLGDLPTVLNNRLVDSNKQVAQSALSVCDNLAKAMGSPCKQYIRVFFPYFLRNLGDNKAQLRGAAKEVIENYAEQCGGYKEFFDGEMIADGLKSGTPQLKIELWEWLAEVLPKVSVKSIPKEELMICVPILYSHLEDRMSDIRANSQKAILGIMIHVGYEAMVKQTEKLKLSSQGDVKKKLDNERGNLPIQEIPRKPEKGDKAVKGTKVVANSKNAVKPKGAIAVVKPAVPNKKKEEDVDTSPLLVVSNMKHQRTIDESKLKILKWNFTTPREEFVDLLRDQMIASNVNKGLIVSMFHSDFSHHIKALEMLMEDLNSNNLALISNLDLVLKWITLRFFDTNPSVVFKCLEYLHSVLQALNEANYKMLENEAASFLPYLILKIGDAKFANGVRSLFKEVCLVYPVNRVFPYLMDGLKSKNARQRAECLELMGSIIQDYGISVCGSSPGPVLKEVGKQISDKDKTVRNAALNCMVEAYNIIGDKVYKMIGNILGKDLSLLESRIKHSKRTTIIKPHAAVPNFVKEPEIVNVECDSGDQEPEANEEEEEDLPPVPGCYGSGEAPHLRHNITVTYNPADDPTGPYTLDPDLLNSLDNIQRHRPKLNKKIQEFDLAFLKDEVHIPSLSHDDLRAKLLPLSPPKPLDANVTFNRLSNEGKHGSPKREDPALLGIIRQIASPDPNSAQQGLEQVCKFLQGHRHKMMVNHENQLFRAIITQLKHLRNQDPVSDRQIETIYRTILTAVDSFYDRNFGLQVTEENLKDIVDQLIYILVDGKMDSCANGDAYVRVINLHCVKAIEKSDHTRVICALIKLMHECIRVDNSPRHTDLVMKCLWRVIKLMPNWGEDLDYDSILLEIHNFLKEFPSTWWKNKPTDTPLRTIKTILHSCVKIRGGSIMLHFVKIPVAGESEIESYILKLLKTMKLDAVQAPRVQLTRDTHLRLTEIFEKIGKKEETKEGLNLLYDFIQQKPDEDIDPFLKKSSKFFQDYIQNGLKEIEEARKIQNLEKSSDLTVNDSEANLENRGAEYWEKRLEMWKRAIGTEPDSHK